MDDAIYCRPAHLSEALSVLADTGAVIAGGQTDLFPLTDAPLLAGPVVDVTNIGEMRGITLKGDMRRIGGASTWTDIIRADLPAAYDMLKLAAREIGSIQIQNSGTIAGNLCNASPAADSVPCLLALDAEVELASIRGVRRLALAEFITGPRQTGRRSDEILTAVCIPRDSEKGISSFRKLGARKYLVISIAMAAVRLVIEKGVISQAAISIGSCSPVACRFPALEEQLSGLKVTGKDAILGHVTEEAVAAFIDPIDDVRGSADYRAQAARALLSDTIEACLKGSGGAS